MMGPGSVQLSSIARLASMEVAATDRVVHLF